jgi:hypothetical protein
MNPYEKLEPRPGKRLDMRIGQNLPEGGLKDSAEAKAVADILGREYKDRVAYYQKVLLKLEPDSPYKEELTPQEIHKRATFATEGEWVLNDSAGDIGWHTLQTIIEHHPEELVPIMMAIKKVAKGNLAISWHAAQAVGALDRPYSRAHFSILLQAFEEDWQPRGAIEQTMLEMMVQYWIMHNHWLEVATNAESLTQFTSTEREDKEHWQGPRLKPAELVERATSYADRYNRMFLRTLRQMRDLRRYNVTINNIGGQVNVATDGGKQVNAMVEGAKLTE